MVLIRLYSISIRVSEYSQRTCSLKYAECITVLRIEIDNMIVFRPDLKLAFRYPAFFAAISRSARCPPGHAGDILYRQSTENILMWCDKGALCQYRHPSQYRDSHHQWVGMTEISTAREHYMLNDLSSDESKRRAAIDLLKIRTRGETKR
jgi:hypothetical protein